MSANELNDRQRRFAEAYAANGGNGKQAAIEAGYSPKTARQQAARLLTNADILKYVRRLQDEAASIRIKSMTAIKAFWSEVIDDTSERMQNRLKASELLAKSNGAFIHTMDDDGYITAYASSSNGNDVIIYLPKQETEEDSLWREEDDEIEVQK